MILENFDELARADKAVLPRDKLNEFVDAWTLLDPEAEEKVDCRVLQCSMLHCNKFVDP